MLVRNLLFIGLLACFIAIASAASIEAINPRYAVVEDNQTYTIKSIGPGQTFAFAVNPIVTTGGMFGAGGRWDYMTVTNYPNGWKAKDSKLYGDPLQIEVTAASNAKDGNYQLLATVFDEGNKEGIGDRVNVILEVEVQQDIFDMDIDVDKQKVSTGQPAIFKITVTNKGEANDVFDVSAKGVAGWDFKKHIYVAAGSQKTVEYEIVGNEEAVMKPVISVTSASSPYITKSRQVEVAVETNLLSDFKAANAGVLLFPLAQLAISGIAALLSLIA